MSDNLKKVVEILNGRSDYKPPAFLLQWSNLYYRTSIHTTGVCPSYYPLRQEGNTWGIDANMVRPMTWIYPQYDYIFDTVLFNPHPREPEVIRQWRKSVYRPYQQTPLQQTIDKIRAVISSDSKYSLIVENPDDSEYIWGNNFNGKNLVDCFFEFTKTICEDPNSLFMVLPTSRGREQKDSKINVYIKHIPSRNIVYFGDDEIIFKEDTLYAWYVNANSYIRYKKNDNGEYEQEDRNGYYAHLLGYAPIHFAGGVWNTHGYYDSYLKPAMAFCDDYVAAQSALKLVNKESSHPFIIASSDDCPSCDGLGHYQWCTSCKTPTGSGNCSCNDASNYTQATCRDCNGSKTQSWNPSEWKIVPYDQMDKDHIKMVNPEMSINEFHAKFTAELYQGIKASLHQQHIEEAQSGKAKEIDREGEYLFYQHISNGMWALFEKLLIDVLSIRNISKANGKVRPDIPKYVLVKPTQFDLKTEYDLLDEFRTATESRMPDYVRQRLVESYFDKVYGGDEVMVKKSEVINELDEFSVTTPADKVAYASAGATDFRTVQFSNVLPKLLDKIIRMIGKERFMLMPIEDIEVMVNTEFAKVPPPKKADIQTEEKIIT